MRARGRVASVPTLRLLASGAALLLASHVLPRAAADAPARALVTLGASDADADAAVHGPAPSDDELLLALGRSAVAADDPVVEARLLKLARHLELGGTAEEHADALVALARDVGLAGEDVVLRRYLVEATRLALARPAGADAPDEATLRAYHAHHTARFTAPARVRATHVHLSAARRGAALDDDAAQLLEEMRARRATPPDAGAFGDPFIRGATIDASQDAVARVFGADFARALETLPAGGWQGPVRSAYGLHLLWIEERVPARVAPLDEVRGRVVHALLRERGEARAQRRLATLRCAGGTGRRCAGEVAPGS